MVHVRPAGGAAEHHLGPAAAQVPRAQRDGERLAVHARQLAVEPRVPVLRGHRRPLLPRLEQARRPAVAHHVHRAARLGAGVLISGTWYYAGRYETVPPAIKIAQAGSTTGPNE